MLLAMKTPIQDYAHPDDQAPLTYGIFVIV